MKVYRFNIFDREDLSFKDTGLITEFSLLDDGLANVNSKFITDSKVVNAKDGDIFQAVNNDTNKQFYLGIIRRPIIKKNTDDFIKLSVQSFNTYFDLEVDSSISEADIETYLETVISETFITTADARLSVGYLNIIKATVTSFDYVTEELNLRKILIDVFTNFNIKIIANINFDTSKIDITISAAFTSYSLQTSSGDILKTEIQVSNSQTINRMDLNDLGVVTFYYLLADNTVVTDPNSLGRILPVVNQKLNRNAQTAQEQAEQKLRGNIYNHVIELEVNLNTKLFDPLLFKKGDKFQIHDDIVYNSILTKIEWDGNDTIKFFFGFIRLGLVELIKRRLI